MKRKSLIAIGLVASTIVAGAALAHGSRGFGDGPGSFTGPGMMMNQPGGGGMMGVAGGMGDMGDMMQMMMRMHGQMMPGGMTSGMGMMGGGMMGAAFDEAFDSDGDSIVSPEELRTGLEARLVGHDSDGDGSLSLSEFETLHSAMIRNFMVDHFQALDEDGDGQITNEEMAAPAKRMERMEMMRGQALGRAAGQMPMGQGTGGDAGTMMNGN